MKTFLLALFLLPAALVTASPADEELDVKVEALARMMMVDADQNADVGLIGNIRIGMKVSEKPIWEYRMKPIEGVMMSAKTPKPEVIRSEKSTTIRWQGKAWRIGKIRYLTSQGLVRTCPLFTASKEEALAFYDKYGFGEETEAAVKKVNSAR